MQKKSEDKSKPVTEKDRFKTEITKIKQELKAYKAERKASWTEFKNQMKLEIGTLKVQMTMKKKG